jgi:GT2 family glycosyltransferase
MLFSVVIPARDSIDTLCPLFESLAASTRQPDQIILVDDGSAESLETVAARYGARLLRNNISLGPATARNQGAIESTAGLIVFLDADVTVHPDTLDRLVSALEDDPSLAGVIGSYDDAPGHPGFLSRYRNLLHAWIHQTASPQASTFWGACGAIRRQALESVGGFPESYGRPAIEDIELGSRLIKAGFKLKLDRNALVCHHKAWTFLKMVRTDVFDRAIPWTRLILREHKMPDDLNLRRSQRLNAVLALLLLFMLPAPAFGLIPLLAFLIVWALYVSQNGRFYAFLVHRHGIWFALRAIPVHWLYFIYSCAGFGLGLAGHLLDGAPKTAAVPQGHGGEPIVRNSLPGSPIASDPTHPVRGK